MSLPQGVICIDHIVAHKVSKRLCSSRRRFPPAFCPRNKFSQIPGDGFPEAFPMSPAALHRVARGLGLSPDCLHIQGPDLSAIWSTPSRSCCVSDSWGVALCHPFFCWSAVWLSLFCQAGTGGESINEKKVL